jgi:hypothetical protein
MRAALAALGAALLSTGCQSVPGGSRADAALNAYRQALSSGSAGAQQLEAAVDAELAGVDAGALPAAARAAARRQHELALSAGPDESLAREEVAWALLERGCASCSRERIAVLAQLARLHEQRGDPVGLESCAARARRLDARDLSAERLGDWPALEQLAGLCERLGDFERAVRIERSLLYAKLQILDAAHPRVAASRARVAELERRALETPPVGAAPADPAR